MGFHPLHGLLTPELESKINSRIKPNNLRKVLIIPIIQYNSLRGPYIGFTKEDYWEITDVVLNAHKGTQIKLKQNTKSSE